MIQKLNRLSAVEIFYMKEGTSVWDAIGRACMGVPFVNRLWEGRLAAKSERHWGREGEKEREREARKRRVNKRGDLLTNMASELETDPTRLIARAKKGMVTAASMIARHIRARETSCRSYEGEREKVREVGERDK
jgi:hypothetical protein